MKLVRDYACVTLTETMPLPLALRLVRRAVSVGGLMPRSGPTAFT